MDGSGETSMTWEPLRSLPLKVESKVKKGTDLFSEQENGFQPRPWTVTGQKTARQVKAGPVIGSYSK
jgi:hypothetical protein